MFCRIRPPSKNEKMANEIVAKCSDPYTISLETPKGHKEYQFDRVFTPEDNQEEIFADTQVNICPWRRSRKNRMARFSRFWDGLRNANKTEVLEVFFSAKTTVSQFHKCRIIHKYWWFFIRKFTAYAINYNIFEHLAYT